MDDVRCNLCGRSAAGDPEFRIKSFQHREAEKEGRVKGPLVYICPVCAGRSRHEAEQQGHGLTTPKTGHV